MKTPEQKKKNGTFAMLTYDQCEIVKEQIMQSMIDASIEAQLPVTEDFNVVSKRIADKIVRNAQMALVQASTFNKVIDSREKKSNNKVVKKTIKVKKNVRK